MATKNMSRTVIEGGRTTRNKIDRYTSNSLQRVNNRRFSKYTTGLVDPDDAGPVPKRNKVRKDFTDKLSPMYRWLGKQVGKKWNDVFSELVHRFDTRTAAGNHVIRDHLLQSVVLNPTDAVHLKDWRGFRNDYYVDEQGILRLHPPKPKKRDSLFIPHRHKSIQEWAASRLIMDYGVSLFWMVPERIEWTKCGYRSGYYIGGSEHCSRKHRFVPDLEKVYFDVSKMSDSFRDKLIKRVEIFNGVHREFFYRETERRECRQGSGKYHQGSRLSAEDVEMWNTLTTHEKRDLLHVGSVQRKLK